MLHWNCLPETVWSDFIIWMTRVFSFFFVAVLHNLFMKHSIYLYLIIIFRIWNNQKYTFNNLLWHNSQKYSYLFKKTEFSATLSIKKLIDKIFNKKKNIWNYSAANVLLADTQNELNQSHWHELKLVACGLK